MILERDAGGRPRIGEFLPDDRIIAEVEAQPTIVRRNGRAKQPGIAAGLPEGAIDDAVRLPTIEMRHQRDAEEFADLIAEQVMIGVIGGAAGHVEHHCRCFQARAATGVAAGT